MQHNSFVRNCHNDSLATLNERVPLAQKLCTIHEAADSAIDSIDRVAVALYDADSRALRSYIDSTHGIRILANYQATLADTPSLAEVLREQRPRVIADLSVFADVPRRHAQEVQQAYRSSDTLPMFRDGAPIGVLFYDSHYPSRFVSEALPVLDLFGQLVTSLVWQELTKLRALTGALKAAPDLLRFRDVETGEHVERVAQYAKLIALDLAPRMGLDESYVERVYLFAPLHDIGKIRVPDRILRKPTALTAEEWAVIKGHPVQGKEIVDCCVKDFGFTERESIEVLRNIVMYHHEAIDGSGYPAHLKGDSIPLESRIVAVADVFDALTSDRVYRSAVNNAEAFAILEKSAGIKLDRECVHALLRRPREVEAIQRRGCPVGHESACD